MRRSGVAPDIAVFNVDRVDERNNAPGVWCRMSRLLAIPGTRYSVQTDLFQPPQTHRPTASVSCASLSLRWNPLGSRAVG